MKELKFEKKGISFNFKNFRIEERFEHKFVVADCIINNKKSIKATYLKKEKGFSLEVAVSVKGLNFKAVGIPQDTEIDTLINELTENHREKEAEEQKIIDSKYTSATIVKIDYNTQHEFSIKGFEDSTEGKKILEILNTHKEEAKENLDTHKTSESDGDYSTFRSYSITIAELKKFINDILDIAGKKRESHKQNTEEKRVRELRKAKETDEKQVIITYLEPSNRDREDDLIIEYAMPDGTIKIEKNRNWKEA